MNEQLLDKLKNAVDIVPDKHDGSYELVRETVEAYASMDSLHDIDYNDLELLYYMAIGTWQINIDKKKKRGIVDTIAAVYILEAYLKKNEEKIQ